MFRPLFLAFYFGPFYKIRWDCVLQLSIALLIEEWRIRCDAMRGKVKRKNRSFEAANKQQQQQQQSFYDAHISFLWENPPPPHHLHHKIKSFGRLVYHTLSLSLYEWTNASWLFSMLYFRCIYVLLLLMLLLLVFFPVSKAQFYLEYII